MVWPSTHSQEFKFSIFTTVFLVSCVGQLTQDKCPHPDKNHDVAILGDSNISRPPSGISQLNVTDVGAYSIDISWSDPVFNFSGTVPIPCHFYLNISYTPTQKGSHTRTTHMNLNYTMRSASVRKLTPGTLVTLGLSTCLLMPDVGDPQRGFICSLPVKITQFTANGSDDCPLGFYNNTLDECAPCQCNNKTQLCESKTGKCLDCLYASDGDQCERCLRGYSLTADNRCEHSRLTISPEYSIDIERTTTTLPINNRITTPKLSVDTSSSLSGKHNSMPTVESRYSTTSSLCTNNTPPVLDTSEPQRPIPVTVIVITVVCMVAVIICIVIIVYRKCGGCRKKPRQFWTVELQPDNQPTIAYSDITGVQSNREDNRLIENDFTSRLSEQQFATDENPYRPITA